MTDLAVVEPRRTRRRRRRFTVDKTEIVNRVLDFYHRDLQDSSGDRELRLQRTAKYRMWTGGKDWPWENSSDIALPDIMEKSLRIQDTLHNAVMSQRPPIGAKAYKKADKDKTKAVDDLIDFQVFEEQPGETVISELADEFVNEGVFTAFIPWVKERREAEDTREFDDIPPDADPPAYFNTILRSEFPSALKFPKGDGWDWSLTEGSEEFEVKFYTVGNKIEMVIVKDVVVYDGPKIITKTYDDVLHPPRAANLQIPGPSNPGGASHVILRDYPSADEVKRLAKAGFYDMSKEDLDKLEVAAGDTQDDEAKTQKDDFQGAIDDKTPDKAKSHRKLTRLMCFDTFDVDNDGIDEDMIWWVIKETKTLVRMRPLTAVYPSNPPRRPFAEATLIPVTGRRVGISLPEMLEGLHDAMKVFFDQTADAGTLRNVPFFFYRATGSLKPEIIRLQPGDGHPLADPQRDVNFPNLQNQGADAFGINMLTILGSFEERLTMVGDLQLGRVPAGKSSALRTVGGMSLLAGQGEARPERILRRFFMGLTEIWRQIHELNQHFLPKGKQYRIFDVKRPSEDPYQEITDRSKIQGRFQFSFQANVLNTSKMALQQSLGTLMGVYVSELAIQLGIIDQDGIYRLMRDFGQAQGADPDKYLKEPTPGAGRLKLMAEEAISAILNTQIPDGEPAEGAVEHLRKIQEFKAGDDFGLFDPAQVEILNGYIKEVMEKAALEQQQAQLARAAGNFSNGGQGQPGRPPEGPPPSLENPPIQGSELLDETMPSAGGGG